MSHDAVGVEGRPLGNGSETVPAETPVIPGYELRRELGHGRMGVVYEARQVLHDRVVALKVIDDEALGGSHNLSAFCAEASAAAHLRHPHIVPILEVGDAEGQPYLATELIRGAVSLEQKVARAPLAPRDAAALLETLARALHHAHQERVLHLDLDPGNVLLTPDGTPHLADFGLAYFRRGHHHGHAFPGNPAYAAPEQFDGPATAVGPATDVYGLGAVLYEALTARPPFLASTAEATLALARAGNPLPPSVLRPDVPRDLEYICLKCLRKAPGQRYASAEALADDLRRFLDGRSVQSAPAAVAGRLAGWCRRNPLAAGLSAGLCLGLAIALGVMVHRYHQATQAWAAAEMQIASAEDSMQLALDKADTQRQARADTERKLVRVGLDLKDLRQKYDAKHKDLLATDGARQKAIQQRDKADTLRGIAEENTQKARQATRQATDDRNEAMRNLVRMHVVAGTQRLEGGDPSAALPWFVEALRLAHKQELPEDAHRLRLAAVLSQCPRPVRLWAPAKEVDHLRLAPDGRVLAVWSDGIASLVDLATGKRVGEEMIHEAEVTHALLSPDGRRLLSADKMGRVRMWDPATGKLAFEAIQLTGPPLGLAFSPDGRRFLTLNARAPRPPYDPVVRVWDAATGATVGMALGSDLTAQPASLSPDGRLVLTCCRDRCARVWDPLTGNQVGASLEHAGNLTHASFSPDGKSILTASADGTARVWHAATGKPVTRPLPHPTTVTTASFSPDGRRVLTAGEDGTVRLWDAATGDPAGQVLRPREPLTHASFSPDGRSVLTASDRGAVRLWDPATGKGVQAVLRHGASVRHVAFSPEGAALLTFDGKLARLWDLTVGTAPGPMAPADKDTGTPTFTPDGSRVVRVTGMKAQVYETSSNKPLGVALTHKEAITGAAFSPDGRRVLTFSNRPKGTDLEGEVRVWDAATGKPVGDALEHLRGVTKARFSPDGSRVVTVSPDQKVRIWDPVKAVLVGKAIDHDIDVLDALFTPDGRRILILTTDNWARIWDAAKGERVNGGIECKGPITHVAFSPDGRQVLVCSADGKARLHETATETEVIKPLTHPTAVTQGVFSPDGTRVLTACRDRAVRVWDSATGKLLTPALRHTAAVDRAAFSDDGRWVVTAAGGRARLWDAATGDPISPPLPHGGEDGRVNAVAYTKDGKLVTAVGVPGDPAGRHIRSLKSDRRPVGDLLALVQVLTDQQLDESGVVGAVGDKAVAQAWRELREKYPADFEVVPQRALAWSRGGAAECERRQLWTGAVRHLDRLLAAAPPDAPDLFARRGRAQAALLHWNAALADYGKALEKAPRRADLWAGSAAASAALGRWDKAVAAYSKAIELSGEDADLRLGRAHSEAEQGHWDKAAADLAKAIRLGRNGLSLWRQNALACFAAGDAAGYRAVCTRMVRRFGSHDEPAVLGPIGWTCALDEKALMDPGPLVRRLERAAADGKSREIKGALGAMLFRSGQFEAAFKRLQEATSGTGTADPRALLFLAMAAQKLGKAAEAKTALPRAIQVLEEAARVKPKEDTPGPLPRWAQALEYKLLRQQAERHVKGGAKP